MTRLTILLALVTLYVVVAQVPATSPDLRPDLSKYLNAAQLEALTNPVTDYTDKGLVFIFDPVKYPKVEEGEFLQDGELIGHACVYKYGPHKGKVYSIGLEKDGKRIRSVYFDYYENKVKDYWF